jgi:hypothetical protein
MWRHLQHLSQELIEFPQIECREPMLIHRLSGRLVIRIESHCLREARVGPSLAMRHCVVRACPSVHCAPSLSKNSEVLR